MRFWMAVLQDSLLVRFARWWLRPVSPATAASMRRAVTSSAVFGRRAGASAGAEALLNRSVLVGVADRAAGTAARAWRESRVRRATGRPWTTSADGVRWCGWAIVSAAVVRLALVSIVTTAAPPGSWLAWFGLFAAGVGCIQSPDAVVNTWSRATLRRWRP